MEISQKENYYFEKYVYPDRWTSYWHQINEVIKTKPTNLLVVGKGDGVVESILKRQINEVKTMDVDEKLMPDFVASVEKMPFQDNYFDTILCAEVLEHLPFNKIEDSLKEIRRICNRSVIISLPHFGPSIKLLIKIPFFREIKVSFKIPFFKKHIFNGEHYWEMGKKDYSSGKVRKAIKKYFKIKKEFIPFNNQYHHFFVLIKNELAN